MSYYDDYDNLNKLVGQTITNIWMDHENLVFEFANGNRQAYTVYGDCCSCSYFYDFLGVEKLLNNGPVVSTQRIDLDTPDDKDAQQGDYVQAYGFEIVTEDPLFGSVTSVVSFRNDSNGYYGGTMIECTVPNDLTGLKHIVQDELGLER
jgi:hypothetical protein